MERFLCIHGHFYQPPRENPWLEAVEIQDSAFPYHDWNERITSECYATNAASRILDDKTRIMDIVSNFAKISFDVGPTLLSWLQKHSPDTYEAILEADRLSVEWRSGHGAAMAQAYNHMIMPLANRRDKLTQVLWGISDFRHRFGREPKGMWLPETAADIETLDILAEQGILFTVLAPHQASRVRPIGSTQWEDVSGDHVNPRMPYRVNLPSGKAISVFFYDGHISRAVAFERLLHRGENFASRLMKGFSDLGGNQLMHIATDGESYGHHHRFGDMALAFALNHIESNNLSHITNYGEYLAKNPPSHEAEIFENTSWSCAHGIERWKSDCGCSTGGKPRWNQKWRAPLRATLDWLRDGLSEKYEEAASKYLKDPWAARDEYIGVILDRSDDSIARFFQSHGVRHLEKSERTAALKLMELQRHLMLMYTSCGWFFDDISGIETVQVLQYAGRAMQIARDVLGENLEPEFIKRLGEAKSNAPEQGDGALVYERHVKTWFLDLYRVAAHYAINSIFEDYPQTAPIYCYRVNRVDYRKHQAGMAVLVVGRGIITSEITGESSSVSFAVLYLGNHDFNCGVRRFVRSKSYEAMTGEIVSAFESGSFADVVRLIDTHFGTNSYSHRDLFRDEQRAILQSLIQETMEGFEQTYRRMYEDNRILMGFLTESDIPVPKAFFTAAEFILNLDLKRILEGNLDMDAINELLSEFRNWGVSIDEVALEFSLRKIILERMNAFNEKPEDPDTLKRLEDTLEAASALPFDTNLWMTQNVWFKMAQSVFPDFAEKASREPEASEWAQRFKALGQRLNFNLEAALPKPE